MLIALRVVMVALFFVVATSSQAAPADNQTFAAISTRMKQADVVRGAFIQEKLFSIMTRPLISKGHFVLDRRQGIWWHNDTPVPGDLVLKDSGILQRNTAGQKQQLASAQQPALKIMTDIIGQLISGDWEQLSRHFDIATDVTATEWHATLTPKTGSLFASYALTVELKGQEYVHFIRIEEKSGDKTTINFTELGCDAQLQPSEAEAFAW